MEPLSYIFGWLYAIIWGFAFYPTIYLSYKIKSSDSISPDYIILNTLGYLSYTVSIALQLFSDNVRYQFLSKFKSVDKLPNLSTIDLMYSIHGTFLNSIVLIQVFYGEKLLGYKTSRTTKSVKFSKLTKFVGILFISYLVFAYLAPSDDPYPLVSLTLNLSYFKMLISFIKYVPQVIHNSRRKSMHGISKLQITLDLSGCIFALLQLIVDNPKKNLLEIINYNRSKAGLILITMFFDTVYITQFFLYSKDTNSLSNNIISGDDEINGVNYAEKV